MENILHYSKAFVPLITAGILGVFGYIGITGDMTVKEALDYIVTSVFVYLVKNAPKRS